MWQPLSKILSVLGRIRIPSRPGRENVIVGDPNAPDALDSTDWKRFVKPEDLFDVWGPHPESRWLPYHCVPLFAALHVPPKDKIGPTAAIPAATIESGDVLSGAKQMKPLGQKWASESAWLILDLPGVASVPLAVRFVAGGYQPVCTFDHWPNPAGLLKPENILAQLLRHATLMEKLRPQITPAAPPVWICDRDRLGRQPGRPREFDNRYYLDDSILPSPEILHEAGIHHIVCMVPTPNDLPSDDLRAYFRDLKQLGFGAVSAAALSDPSLTLFEFPPTAFDIKFDPGSYKRSAVGGFGQLIPEPGSSSG